MKPRNKIFNKNDGNEKEGLLSSIEKKNNFSVPENYFDDFAWRVQKKLPVNDLPFNILNIIFGTRMIWTYSFAFFIIISSVIYFNTITPVNQPDNITLKVEDIDNIDEFLIADQIDEKSLESDIISKDFDQAEMEDYLIENHIDVSTIINHVK